MTTGRGDDADRLAEMSYDVGTAILTTCQEGGAHMRNLRRLLVLLCVAFLAFTSAGYASPKLVVLRLAHPSAATHAQHKAFEEFSEIVWKNSGGTLKVEIFPGGQLGGERDQNEGVQLGTIDMGLTSAGVLATFAPEMNLFNMPFLFRDARHFTEVATGDIGRQVLKALEKRGFIGLCLYGASFRIPYNWRRPLAVPADFKGLKIRLMEVPAHMDAYRALGAAPTPMAYGELYTGLQLKVIDGAENSWSYIYSQRFYEQTKYISEIPIFCNPLVFVASRKVWDKLSQEHRQAIMDAIPQTTALLNELYTDLEDKAREEVAKAGLIINSPPDLEPFIEATEWVRKKYTDSLPADIRPLVDRIIEAGAGK